MTPLDNHTATLYTGNNDHSYAHTHTHCYKLTHTASHTQMYTASWPQVIRHKYTMDGRQPAATSKWEHTHTEPPLMMYTAFTD